MLFAMIIAIIIIAMVLNGKKCGVREPMTSPYPISEWGSTNEFNQ